MYFNVQASLVAQGICLQCGRLGFDPWVEKIPLKEGMANPLQYFCLKYLQGQRSLWATVYGVAKRWT